MHIYTSVCIQIGDYHYSNTNNKKNSKGKRILNARLRQNGDKRHQKTMAAVKPFWLPG